MVLQATLTSTAQAQKLAHEPGSLRLGDPGGGAGPVLRTA
jgi:hypothetical protein